MFTFFANTNKKLLIFLLIISFSIFFKGCTSDSKITTYQVGFPWKVFDVILNGNLELILEDSFLLSLLFNLSVVLLVTLIGLLVYKRFSVYLQSKINVFMYLFFSHLLIHNGSLLIDSVTRLYNGNIFLIVLFFPVIIINFFYVDFPLVMLNLLLTGARSQISDHTLRLSFVVVGLLASLLGTILFSLKILNTKHTPNISGTKEVGIKTFLFEYFPYYLLSVAIVLAILYSLVYLLVEEIR